jgi:hypothetical protein
MILKFSYKVSNEIDSIFIDGIDELVLRKSFVGTENEMKQSLGNESIFSRIISQGNPAKDSKYAIMDIVFLPYKDRANMLVASNIAVYLCNDKGDTVQIINRG